MRGADFNVDFLLLAVDFYRFSNENAPADINSCIQPITPNRLVEIVGYTSKIVFSAVGCFVAQQMPWRGVQGIANRYVEKGVPIVVSEIGVGVCLQFGELC